MSLLLTGLFIALCLIAVKWFLTATDEPNPPRQ